MTEIIFDENKEQLSEKAAELIKENIERILNEKEYCVLPVWMAILVKFTKDLNI